jgi:heptosyltransferase-2
MDRILVVRGGAIGDFLLTLPALKALREARPDSHIEILGYKHIAEVAENRFYAQAVRSIEYGPLSRFFAKNLELPAELTDYFRSFDLVVSYLYDPDEIFHTNLRRCAVRSLVCGPGKIVENDDHAARQLARPMEELGLRVIDIAEKIFLSQGDREFGRNFIHGLPKPLITIHPGSGSKGKNWPLKNWMELFVAQPACAKEQTSLIVVSGEADTAETAQLESAWRNHNIRFAKNLPLPQLAAVLEHSVFIGNDSGISHLAAAAGANCTLLFGPTNPKTWAPKNENVRVLRPRSGKIGDLEVAVVRAALTQSLADQF